jgi:hypothetical protein
MNVHEHARMTAPGRVPLVGALASELHDLGALANLPWCARSPAFNLVRSRRRGSPYLSRSTFTPADFLLVLHT